MGNTCCHGRPQQITEDNGAQKQKHTHQAVRRRLDSLKRGTTTVQFGKKGTLAPDRPRQKRKSVAEPSPKSAGIESESPTRAQPQDSKKTLLFSELHPETSDAPGAVESDSEEEVLDFRLSTAQDCSPEQRLHILELFAKNGSKGEEEMSGFTPVLFCMNAEEFPCAVLVSNKALYQLPRNNFQNVVCRIKLEKLVAMVITRSRDFVQLTLDDQEDWLLKCSNMEDLLRAVQTVYHEHEGIYLPALTLPTRAAITSWRRSLSPKAIADLRASAETRVNRLFVTHGEIGENRLLAAQCSCEDIPGVTVHFVLSHKAIYTVADPSFRMLLKIPLKNVDSLSATADTLVAISSEHEYKWHITNPAQVLETLEPALEAEKLRQSVTNYQQT